MIRNAVRWLRVGEPDWRSNWQKELIYERLFSNTLTRLDLVNDFYPINGAANFSLLYLLLRSITETGVRSVLEFGCGQTSLLLDRLADRYDLTLLSVEHDAQWAQMIGQKVRHPVHHVELAESEVAGRRVYGYRDDPAIQGTFDLVLVDGPFAATYDSRFSRLSTLPYVTRCSPEDGLVIVDDYQRAGERELAGRCMEIKLRKYPDALLAITEAAKWQGAVTCGRFTPVRFF